jgi:hypothetical protein
MQFFTREQVAEFDHKQTVKHLKALTKEYDLDKPLTEQWQLVWTDLDQIVDTLLYLEDHIRHLELSETATRTMTARWAKEKAAE